MDGEGIPQVQQDLEKELLSKLSSKISVVDPLKWKEFGLTIKIGRDSFFECMSTLKDDDALDFSMLVDVTCVDWMDERENRFEVVYQLMSVKKKHRLCVKVELPEAQPEVDSVLPLWPSANFLEREVYDLFGITFLNHGDLRRILMYDEFVGFPLRKDYPLRGKQPRVTLRVPELRNTSADLHRDALVALPRRSSNN